MAPIFPKDTRKAPATTPTGGSVGMKPKGTLNVYKLPADSDVHIYADGKPVGADVPFSEALEGPAKVAAMRFAGRRVAFADTRAPMPMPVPVPYQGVRVYGDDLASSMHDTMCRRARWARAARLISQGSLYLALIGIGVAIAYLW